MKKLLAILLSLAMLVCSVPAAFAQETAAVTVAVDYYSNKITVEYNNIADYTSYVNVYMANENDVDGNKFSKFEKAVRMDMAKVDANKDVIFEFTFGEDIKNGSYYFFVAQSGAQSDANYCKSPLITVVSLENAATEVLPYINGGDATNAAENAYEKLAEVFGFPETSSPAWKDEYIYNIKVEDFGGAYTNIAQVEDAWYDADVLYAAKTAEDGLSDKITALIEEFGLDAQNEDYVNFKNKFEELFQTNLNTSGANSAADAKAQFNKTAAFIAINNRDIEGKAKAIEQYQKEYGISDSLLEDMKEKTIVAVIRNMGEFTVATSEELIAIIEETLPNVDDAPSYTPSGSGNGGGGGGFGSGTTVGISPELEQQLSKDYISFKDVPTTHWAIKPVEYLAAEGIVSGNGDGTFAPDRTVTREEFVKMVVGAFKIAGSGDIAFTDVAKSHWAYGYINAAVENGIVKGISDNKFGMGSLITRQDMAVIMSRIIELKGIQLQSGTVAFTDSAAIADYAKDAVELLAGAGIINGYEDGSFKPEGSLTRAEAAKVIYAIVVR